MLTDVTPLSLGVAIQGKIMDVVVPRNSKLPVKATKTYHTLYDQQTEVFVKVKV